MEQIYYTQCPVGYGLGASNGFQIKRRSEGYPLSGDFRHLGMRAFLPGTRTLAPPTLRYRRDGDVAELAWLSPRLHEYHTERGLWGRPGGHFAHGLRLDPAELDAIQNWPAALQLASFWKTSDVQPSLGRPPEPFELTSDAGLARFDWGELDPSILARLLAATAWAARDGRTHFLIDQPERLAAWVALLTLAFPRALRADLTFSTYHDRPEELPGFRIQGTTPSARPNRNALLALGFISDLSTRTFEPELPVPAWARTLSLWMCRASESDQASREATDRRASRARLPSPRERAWSDDWLDGLIGFESALRGTEHTSVMAPMDGSRLASIADWAGEAGLGPEWYEHRSPAWWLQSITSLGPSHGGRLAIKAHARLKPSWGSGDAILWGQALAIGWAGVSESELTADVLELLGRADPDDRPAFLTGLLRTLPDPTRETLLQRLRIEPSCDRASLLPQEVRVVVAALAAGDPAPTRSLLTETFARWKSVIPVLDEFRAEAGRQPELRRELIHEVARAIAESSAAGLSQADRWALGLEPTEVTAWLGERLRRAMADPRNMEIWSQIRDRTEPDQRAALTQAWLDVARSPTIPQEAFIWAVEELLLALPEEQRPPSPGGATAYLEGFPSDLELLRRLYGKSQRQPALAEWLAQALAHSELSPRAAARLENLRTLARGLRSGDVRALLEVDLAQVTPGDRGKLLRQMLSRVDQGRPEPLDLLLGACRIAWPDSFRVGRTELPELADAIADASWLAEARPHPAEWFHRLSHLIEPFQPGVDTAGFEPDGLAAHVAASTLSRAEGSNSVWPFRHFLLHHEKGWRLLAEDLRRALLDARPTSLLATVEEWDQRLPKDALALVRFYELVLNACDGRALGIVVPELLPALRSLPELRWWRTREHPGSSDDIRDAFARLIPMKPLAANTLDPLRRWMGRAPERETGTLEVADFAVGDHPTAPVARPAYGEPRVSPFARDRWRCIEALTGYARAEIGEGGRWRLLEGWFKNLPVDQLDETDRYRVVAWVIRDLDRIDELANQRLAAWLVRRARIRDADRLKRWAEEIQELEEVPGSVRLGRVGQVTELWSEVKRVLQDER